MQTIYIFFRRNFLSMLKFAVVGTTGLFIDFSITWLLRDYFLVGDYLSSSAGFAIAACTNYYINKKWTFEDRTSITGKQFGAFFIIAFIGLGLHMTLIYFFRQTGIAFYLAKILATCCVLVWNFTANKLFTFGYVSGIR